MSAVFDDGSTEPRLHAFVVGVGDYPFLRDGSAFDRASVRHEVAWELGQLESAPNSAVAVAEWLLRFQVGDSRIPLGSLEVVVSARRPVEIRGRIADRATYPVTERAVRAWLERGSRNANNVMVFFFAGHGCEIGKAQFLMCEEVGSENDFLGGAFDLTRLCYGVIQECPARSYVFLADACRTDLRVDATGCRSLVTLGNGAIGTAVDAILVTSTQAGRAAHGERGGLTDFTECLLRAFDGLAGTRDSMCAWVINTYFDRPLREVMRRRGAMTDPEMGQLPSTGPFAPAGGVLRALAGPPRVPFEIASEPAEALASARLTLTAEARGEPVLVREPALEPWVGEAPAGIYRLDVSFACGSFVDEKHSVYMEPPYTRGRFAASPKDPS